MKFPDFLIAISRLIKQSNNQYNIATLRNLKTFLQQTYKLTQALDIHDIHVSLQYRALIEVTAWVNGLYKSYKAQPEDALLQLIDEAENFIKIALLEKKVQKAYFFESPCYGLAEQSTSLIAKAVVVVVNFDHQEIMDNSVAVRRDFLARINPLLGIEPLVAARRYCLQSNDDAKIDCIQYFSLDEHGQRYPMSDYVNIVKFHGNATSMAETCENLCEQVSTLQDKYQRPVCITTMDYRCSRYSTGNLDKMQDLVDDGVALVTDLYQRGANPETIVIVGQSLGGAIAVATAAKCHDGIELDEDRREKIPVAVINLRSFHHVSHVIPGVRFLGWSIKSWELNIAKLYSSIPSDKKSYLLVKPNKNYVYQNKDLVIGHGAALYTGLKKLAKTGWEISENCYNQGYDPTKTVAQNKADKDARKLRVKVNYKDYRNLHNLPLYVLENRDGQCAQDILDDFIAEQIARVEVVDNNFSQ